MKEKKLGNYLLVELDNDTITLYKKWTKATIFETTDYSLTSNDKDMLNDIFSKINTRNVYKYLKK